MSMRQRIFIAINLPENVRKKLVSFQEKWPDLPCRWTKEENLHITLVFLGYFQDQELLEIIKITKEAASKNQPFFITFNKIMYGPPSRGRSPLRRDEGPSKTTPRLVWVEGEKSQELGKLQKDLEGSLLGLSSELPEEQGRGYIPHITLGRLKQWEFRKIEPEERPEINEEINLSFEVSSIEVMGSQLKRGGAEYTILESCPLSKE